MSAAPWDGPAARAAREGAPVDVVVVNWNGRHHLARCLPAIFAQTYRPLRAIVADNASSDGSAAWLRAEWPEATVLETGGNLGFAAGNNVAIAAGDAPWVALINADAEPEPDWLAALVAAGDATPRAGSVASAMVFADEPGVVNSAGIALDPTGIAWDRLGGAPAAAAASPATVFGASAGAALYRRAALDDVAALHDGEVFDPRYFMYLEDVDLAWRLRLAGWDAAYAPAARARHAGSASAGEGSAFKNRLLARNKIWTVVKDYPAAGLARWGPLVVGYDLMSAPYRLVLAGQTAAIEGRIQALAGLGPMLARRRVVQADRRATWAEVRAAMEPAATPLGVMRRYRHLARRAVGGIPPVAGNR